MRIPHRKSSTSVTLVLIGAATLAACGQQGDALRRDLYANKEDCVKDWGEEPKCEQQVTTGTTHSGGGAGFWIGPGYRPGQFGSIGAEQTPGTISAARPGSHAIATSH